MNYSILTKKGKFHVLLYFKMPAEAYFKIVSAGLIIFTLRFTNVVSARFLFITEEFRLMLTCIYQYPPSEVMTINEKNYSLNILAYLE